MKDVANVAASDTSFVVNTGSPHFMQFVADVKKEDIVSRGREIRYSDSYKRDGINVNLIEQLSEDAIRIRTYERGVEDETLSCGTGATACALVLAEKNGIIGSHRITVDVEGGQLQVAFNRTAAGSFTDIELIGPAEFVFKGEIHV
jgi:diaminopimelate epimerase